MHVVGWAAKKTFESRAHGTVLAASHLLEAQMDQDKTFEAAVSVHWSCPSLSGLTAGRLYPESEGLLRQHQLTVDPQRLLPEQGVEEELYVQVE